MLSKYFNLTRFRKLDMTQLISQILPLDWIHVHDYIIFKFKTISGLCFDGRQF